MALGETLEIVLPATAAGLMIAAIHSPVGIEVLRRGIIFIDLAIAQEVELVVLVVGKQDVEVAVGVHVPPGRLADVAGG